MGSRILLICDGQRFIYLSKEKTEEKKAAPLGNPPNPATRLARLYQASIFALFRISLASAR